MIQGLWVIDESGLCLFHESFNETVNQDPLVISGFLSAIFTFSQEIGQKRLELTETDDFRFVYTMKPPLLFVVAGAKQDSPDTLNRYLHQIKQDFFHHYEEIAWQTFLKSQQGNYDVFEDYKSQLMKLLGLSERESDHQERRDAIVKTFSKFVKSSKKKRS
jgi:hypothetical protein